MNEQQREAAVAVLAAVDEWGKRECMVCAQPKTTAYGPCASPTCDLAKALGRSHATES